MFSKPKIVYTDKRPHGANASHRWFFWIHVWKDAEHRDAIQAQEEHEWEFIRNTRLTCAAVVSVLYAVLVAVVGYPILLAALPVAAGIGLMLPMMPLLFGAKLREMELRGKMTEVVVAAARYGVDYERKLREEALSLKGYGQFSGWSEEKITQAMRERYTVALSWATKHKYLTLPAV